MLKIWKLCSFLKIMLEKFLTFVRPRIGVVLVMTLTANTILLFAIQAYVGSTPSDQGHDLFVKQKILHKNNLDKMRQNSTKSKTLKKNSERGRVNVESELSQMEYLPNKSLKIRDSNEVHKEGNLLVNKDKKASISRKQIAIEQINALANVKADQVYHMYDDANETNEAEDHAKAKAPNEAEDHAKVKHSEDKFNGNQKVPNTFNAKYVEYFWRYPELFKERSSDKVLQEEPNDQRKDNNEKDKNIPNDKIVQSKTNESKAEGSKTCNYMALHRTPDVIRNNQKPISPTKHYITIFPAKGQLGNQMFQSASLLGIAEFGNFTPFLRTSVFGLNKVFQLPLGFFKDTDITDFDHFMEDPHFQNVSIRSSQTLDKCRDWTLDGYFQSFKYFSHVADKIRRYFKFHKALLVQAVDFLQTTVPDTHVKVAIHIRRGDFINSQEVSLGRVAASPGKYYLYKITNDLQTKSQALSIIISLHISASLF